MPKKMELSEEERELLKWKISKMKPGACVRIPLNRRELLPEQLHQNLLEKQNGVEELGDEQNSKIYEEKENIDG